MASTSREIRTIRIEDWNGNIYHPEGVGGGSAGDNNAPDDFQPDTGSTGGAGSITSDTANTTAAVSTTDSNATTGKVLVISAGTTAKNVATALFDNLPFGKIAVSLRLKSSNGTTTSNIIQVNTYYVDLTQTNSTVKLSSTNFTGAHVGVANTFVDLGFVTEFKGVHTANMAFKVEVLILPNTGVTVTLDNVSVNKAFVAITGTPTTLS
ncbi:MAG: hypothetical protein IKA36_02045 [Clostridia bacterium]|nr:hypothetical protein [Clostridia bacterium]